MDAQVKEATMPTKMSKEEVNVLKNAVRNDLRQMVKELGYRDGEGGWRSGFPINEGKGENAHTLATVSFKESDVYVRGKGFFPALFVSIKGGYQARHRDGGRSVTFRVSGLDKLDTVKARIRLAIDATLEGIEYEKDVDAERKSTNRATLKTLKAHGFVVKNYRGEDWDEETDDRIVFGNSGQRADGMVVGVDNLGEITVRLPKGMSLDDFLKKLG